MTSKSRAKRTKEDFPRDEQGRVILGTAQEMAAWVRLGFVEQDKKRTSDDPFYQHFIDLRNCVLYISYPIDSKGMPASKIFNLCHMAGIVPGIENIEGDSNYLYEVKLDIHFDGSVLYGNFFHYVKFYGMVKMDATTILGLSSCFKCLFNGYVYMQGIHLNGGYTFEQCEFNKGLTMKGAEVGSINSEFSNCTFKERLSLARAHFTKREHSNPIEIRNSVVENLNISKIRTDGIPLFIQYASIRSMKMDNLKVKGAIGFNNCTLEGILTSIVDENNQNNEIKELLFHECNVKAQCHIENCDIDKWAFTFSKIEDAGRLRFYQCGVEEIQVVSSTIEGRMDFRGGTVSTLDLEESHIPGYFDFVGNEVKQYKNRETLRLLKNEALKVNDEVAAIHLYALEMQMLLDDKGVSFWDKLSLRFNKLFSNFGENWLKALGTTLLFSVVLTLFMLGFGSGKFGLDYAGEFIGVGAFVTILLDSINVFSIPLFSDTVKAYDLNVLGQILYFLIKVVVAYGTYLFVVAFRKHGRR